MELLSFSHSVGPTRTCKSERIIDEVGLHVLLSSFVYSFSPSSVTRGTQIGYRVPNMYTPKSESPGFVQQPRLVHFYR